MSVRELWHERPNGSFSKSRGLSASVSFLSSPRLLALLIAPFFAPSLTLVPRSLFLNCTETLATQATKLMANWLTKSLKRATNSGKAMIRGKRVNTGGGYGPEIPCEFHFTGDEFSINWLREKLKKEGFDAK